jgi:hypothetical protein
MNAPIRPPADETPAPPDAPFPTRVDPETGEIFLILPPEWQEYFADWNWVDDEYNARRWDEYAGNYIAVYHKQLLGHGPDPNELRDRVAREHQLPPGLILTTYIEPPIEC